MRKIGVAAVGDVLDVQCLSGSPYYFFNEGKKAGIVEVPWKLDIERLRYRRILWNIKSLLLGRGKGGYQYSNEFLAYAESFVPEEYFGLTVISFSQTFPRASSVVRKGGKIFYYIDATLNDLFAEASYKMRVSKSMMTMAQEIERQNYSLADGVVTMGSWVHESLMKVYGLPSEKVHHVLPGANLVMPKSFVAGQFLDGAGVSRDFVLGFVGKDWERKGLSVLLDVRDELARRGFRVVIKVIGNRPDKLLDREGLDYSGYINKLTSTEQFVDTLSQCDIGCLFSTSEALGISTLEFLRVGVPVAGYWHQGMKDTLMDGASLRFDLTDSVTTIADTFERYLRSQEVQEAMKEKAIHYSNGVSWSDCVDAWRPILNLT